MKKKTNNTRTIATQVLLQVLEEGQSLQAQWVAQQYPKLAPRDKAYVMHLCYGVLRFYPRLEEWANQCLHKPLKEKDFDLLVLMMVGLYQLFYTDTPPYAASHATVEAAVDLGKPWAKGLINSVLREALRKGDHIHDKNSLCAKTAHPLWLIKALQKAWPEQWENIVEENIKHPPFSLRVNLQKTTTATYLEHLAQANIAAEKLDFVDSGIQVAPDTQVEDLPGFREGMASIQDGAAQFAATLLALEPQHRVLDACAAPGGKTAHILEVEPKLSYLLAIEKDPERLARLKNTLDRLSLRAELRCNDATMPETWWDQKPFDRILLDVPCSATGVIRRHPDIKYHRQPEDVHALLEIQAMMLQALWPLLKPGGVLVYATCSILPAENTEQIAYFLSQQPDAKEWPIEADWGIPQPHGRQILPGQHQMDGFYYARLRKEVLN